MALTLKASGVATACVQVIAVDGSTIKEFVSGATIGSGLTQTGTLATGSRTWNGHASTAYLQTNGTDNSLEITSPPTNSNPTTVMFVFAETGAISGTSFLSGDGAGVTVFGHSSGVFILGDPSNATAIQGTVVSTTSAYSLSLSAKATNAFSYFALEGNTAVAVDRLDASPSGALSSDVGLKNIGTFAGGGRMALKLIVSLVMNRDITLAEFNAIHGDPIGTLFDGGGAPPELHVPVKGTVKRFRQ